MSIISNVIFIIRSVHENVSVVEDCITCQTKSSFLSEKLSDDERCLVKNQIMSDDNVQLSDKKINYRQENFSKILNTAVDRSSVGQQIYYS